MDFILEPKEDFDCEIHIGEGGYETDNWKFDQGDRVTIIPKNGEWHVIKIVWSGGTEHWPTHTIALGKKKGGKYEKHP